MFKRLNVEEWMTAITIIAFILTFSTFVFFTVRALMTKKEKLDHAANLPLEGEENTH